MNTAIVLAGGVGSRMGLNRPKQFINVGDKPVISFCLNTFQNHPDIQNIVIVAANEWQDYIKQIVDNSNINKFRAFALSGNSRQESIFNGLIIAEKFTLSDDIVIIHDAVRPLVSKTIISDCILGAAQEDGAMPVIPVKDTIYQSFSGDRIDNLLSRNELFAGQAPEAFNFGKYLNIHKSVPVEEIENTAGSSEIAYRNGMKIRLVEGSETNFKITTKEDLSAFKAIVAKNEDEYIINGKDEGVRTARC